MFMYLTSALYTQKNSSHSLVVTVDIGINIVFVIIIFIISGRMHAAAPAGSRWRVHISMSNICYRRKKMRAMWRKKTFHFDSSP